MMNPKKSFGTQFPLYTYDNNQMIRPNVGEREEESNNNENYFWVRAI